MKTTLHTHTATGYLLFFAACCLLATVCRPLQAQTLSGTVTDAESRQPLEAVMLCVMRENKTIDYALTDAKGHYSLPWKHYGDTLQLSASLLGYRREVRRVSSPGWQDFELHTESIVLKEVQIRGGRVQGRKDTVRYDLAQFASEKDVHIKDVLKRLPGVDVEENGQVKYKGKPIDHFLVEGMDVTGGRYNQVNNNLSAKAVKTAEIMENYQSVKALKDRINSDEVALNLKLDPKARDQWIVNTQLGMGYSQTDEGGGGNSETDYEGKSSGSKTSPLLWEGLASALQLGKGKQNLYSYKTNNNGRDLGNEQARLTNRQEADIPLTAPLAQPGISAPLDRRRLLFNRTHTLNGNRMYKWNNRQSLRLQTGYTYDEITQERRNTLAYYQPGDTLRTDETYRYRLLSNAAYTEAHYEDNSPRHYLSNRLHVEGSTGSGTSQGLQQKIRTTELKASNRLHLLRSRETETWEVDATVQYALLPSTLQVAGEREKYRRQSLYADQHVGYLRKYNGFTRQYRAGVQGEWGTFAQRSAHTSDVSSLTLYLSPYFQLERGKWLGSLTLPFRAKRFFGLNANRLLYSPSLYLRCQADYHWRFSLSVSLDRSAGNDAALYASPYRTDYRTWWDNRRLLPIALNRSYRIYGEYKNTVHEFFATASLSHQRTRQNTLYEQSVTPDSTIYTRRSLKNRAESWAFRSMLSKGFYDWHLKTSLTLSLSRNRGKQLTNSRLQAYRYDYLQAEPKLTWSPVAAFEAEYHATLGYGGSKIGSGTRLTPLLDVVQRLHLTFGIGRLDLRLCGEHYRNDLDAHTHLSTLLADASLVYKAKKWRLEARLNNLFNKKEYAYTLYSATQSSTSRLGIRPREGMVVFSRQL